MSDHLLLCLMIQIELQYSSMFIAKAFTKSPFWLVKQRKIQNGDQRRTQFIEIILGQWGTLIVMFSRVIVDFPMDDRIKIRTVE